MIAARVIQVKSRCPERFGEKRLGLSIDLLLVFFVCNLQFAFQVLLKSNLRDHHNSLVRKYMVKLVQRIGLLFLPAKVASWRYKVREQFT
jgi:hypothetical protein